MGTASWQAAIVPHVMRHGMHISTSAVPSDQPPVKVESNLAALKNVPPPPPRLRASEIAPPGMMILRLHGEIAWWGRVGDPNRFGVEFDEVLLNPADFADLQARAAS